MKTILSICFAVGMEMSGVAAATDGVKPLDDLVTLPRIPDALSVSNITLVPAPNVSHGGKLDASGFRQILEHSSSASPELAKSWQFAPWYTGTFMQAGKTNSFSLYLGGLGLLVQPDGTKGLFRFKQHEKRRQ